MKCKKKGGEMNAAFNIGKRYQSEKTALEIGNAVGLIGDPRTGKEFRLCLN